MCGHRGILEDCRKKGYKIAYESEVPKGKGYFIPLVILDNPPDDARVVQEEREYSLFHLAHTTS